MKKFVNMSTLLGIAALLILLAVGSAAAAPPLQFGPGEIEPELEPESGGGLRGGGASLREDAPAEPSGTAVRINFEVSGHKARRGLYIIQDSDGNLVASWWAYNGQVDSGWFENIDISRETIHVQVLYYPGPNTKPTVMKIVNHAPGSAYGWMSQGIGHALEVAWPDKGIYDRNL